MKWWQRFTLGACACVAGLLHAAEPPALMLATPYREGVHVPDYWISEKLDGVRARWDGHRLISRGGQTISPPDWFVRHWPADALDGELWIARGRFDDVSALVRSLEREDRAWREVNFMVFDLPAHPGTFEQRVARMRTMLADPRMPWLRPVGQFRLDNETELQRVLRNTVEAGGEGLMLHHGSARYVAGRSEALMKLKPFEDAEARVVAHVPGKGKHAGRLGALEVAMKDGRRFRLGTGFTDRQRENPPAIGSWVTFRHRGLTRQGLPRFASFLRVRTDAHATPPDAERAARGRSP